MSREILFIAGPPGHGRQAARRRRVEAAAERVPGWRGHEVLEHRCAVAALVSTEPAGGTSSSVEWLDDGFRAGIGTSDAGLAVAMKASASADLGSEAGHVIVETSDAGRVRLATDGAAYVPSYWAHVDDEFYVSTHLASIISLGVSADIDEQGILEYLVLMHPWGHRTLLRHVELLGPGSTVTWQNGQLGRADQPLYMPSDDAMSDDEAVAEFTRLWPVILDDLRERTSDQRVMLGLSGGMDSRAIAVGAHDLGWSPLTYTYGTSRNREADIAHRVSERLGVPHLQIPVTDDALLHNAGRIVDVLDGAHSPGEMYELWFDDRLRSVSDVIVNGLVAGPLWGDDKTMGLTDRNEIRDHLWRRFQGATSAARPFVASDVGHRLPEVIRFGIDESLEPWDLSQRRDMTMFWKQANKLLRWGNMLTNSLRRSGLRLEAPFLDSRFLQFAARLTPAQRLNGSLYLRVHREVLDATADIPRSDDGNCPAALNHLYWSGERSFSRQMIDLAARHPVSGLRRGGRRAVDIAGARFDRTGTGRFARRRAELASVFPADLWARTTPVYAERLAGLLDAAQGAGTILSDEMIAEASASLRAGRSTAPAQVLSRVAAAGVWVNDYRQRERAARVESA